MNFKVSLTRNTNDNTIRKILTTLHLIDGISVMLESDGLFKTNLNITSREKLNSEELVALGCLIGCIEAANA